MYGVGIFINQGKLVELGFPNSKQKIKEMLAKADIPCTPSAYGVSGQLDDYEHTEYFLGFELGEDDSCKATQVDPDEFMLQVRELEQRIKASGLNLSPDKIKISHTNY